MRKGIIDIGSNTIKLKVFEFDKIIYSNVFPVQLGAGLQNLVFTQEAILKFDSCIKEIDALSEENEFQICHVIATSAMRDAKNSNELEAIVENRLGVKPKVIHGDEEAGFIYQGVRKGITSNNDYLICDIGGGSVELIYGNNQNLIKARSFELGVFKLYKLRKFQDPYSIEDIEFVLSALDSEMFSFLSDIEVTHLVGAAGSFKSIASLVLNDNYEYKFLELDVLDVHAVLEFVLNSTLVEREANMFIPIEREVLLPLGAIIVKYLLDKLEINKFTVSPNSLIEGLV